MNVNDDQFTPWSMHYSRFSTIENTDHTDTVNKRGYTAAWLMDQSYGGGHHQRQQRSGADVSGARRVMSVDRETPSPTSYPGSNELRHDHHNHCHNTGQ